MFFRRRWRILPLLVFHHWQLPPIVGVPVGVVVSLASRSSSGMPTFRSAGHYFSMATIAVAELIRLVIGTVGFRRRAIGLQGPAVGRGWWDLTFRGELPYYFIFLACWCPAARHLGDRAHALRLLSARHQGGRARRALARRAGAAHQALCADAERAFTSIAGSLYAIKTGFIDPESGFGILVSVQMVIIAALGGADRLRPAGRRAHPDPAADLDQHGLRRRRHRADYILYGGIIVIIARFEPAGCTRCGTASRRNSGSAPMLA
jgi:branched-chain amino acid transport system permease protein